MEQSRLKILDKIQHIILNRKRHQRMQSGAVTHHMVAGQAERAVTQGGVRWPEARAHTSVHRDFYSTV